MFSFLALFICTVYFFYCNAYFPIMSDDYTVSFIWDGAHGGNIAGIQEGHIWNRIESLSDIFTSLSSMYMTWGGRMESWFISQFFLFMGKSFFNICNTIVFLVFLLLLARISLGTNYLKNGWYIFWLFSGLWLVNYAFFNTMVWVSGAANYLWLMVFQLLFLLPYVETFRGIPCKLLEKSEGTVKATMVLAGLLAGNTNENSAFAVMLAAAWIWHKIRRPWMRYGLLGIATGYGALLFAPGNYVRYHIVMTAGEGDYLPPLAKGIIFLWLLAKEIPLFFLFTPYLKKKIRQQCHTGSLQKKFQLMLLFGFMGLISALAMLAAPMIPPRTFFGTSVFWLIAATQSIRLMTEGEINYYRPFIVRTACALLMVFTLYTTGTSLYAESLLSEGYQKMVNQCLANRNSHVVIPWRDLPILNEEIRLSQRSIINHDLFGNWIGHIRPGEKQWMNQAVAAYYQLKSIRLDVDE